MSEEGRKQQNKLKDLSPIAERLGCTLPQLAVGERVTGEGGPAGSQRVTAFSIIDHIAHMVKYLVQGQTISEANTPG